MSNVRGGGSIVIGVEEKDEVFTPVGLSGSDLASFSQDEISAYVNEYADPFAEPTVHRVAQGGMDFVIIEVPEFFELPVVCKKNGPDLRRGAIYTRARRMNESVEVPSQTEMREILDAALEKRFRAMLRMLDVPAWASLRLT